MFIALKSVRIFKLKVDDKIEMEALQTNAMMGEWPSKMKVKKGILIT